MKDPRTWSLAEELTRNLTEYEKRCDYWGFSKRHFRKLSYKINYISARSITDNQRAVYKELRFLIKIKKGKITKIRDLLQSVKEPNSSKNLKTK